MEKVTKDMVSNWVGNTGNAAKRDAWMIETLTEIANDVYTAADLRREVKEYNE